MPLVLPPLKQVPSPNYSSRNGQAVRLIVVHDCEGDDFGEADATRPEHDGGQDRAEHRRREEVAESRDELARAHAPALHAEAGSGRETRWCRRRPPRPAPAPSRRRARRGRTS